MPELVSAYCLGYQHFTVIPHHMEESFRDMVDMGFDAVCLTFSESEMVYSRRAFEIQVNLAKRAGLKVFVVPSRLGGRFAGAPLMPSFWLANHPECQVPGGRGWPLACLESPAFVEWITGFMTTLVSDYELDGIVWDEPKGVAAISRHPDTVARYGPEPSKEEMIGSFLKFLSDLTAHCRTIRPELLVTLFNQKTDPEEFTREATRIDGIDYAGFDGNLSRQSFFHEEPEWHKYRLESVWDRTVGECREAEKKTFALVENMLMPREAIPEFEQNFEAYLQDHHPDHLAVYYYAHNNEDPEAVHAVVRRLMKKYVT